ncbi:PGAP2-interacting protein-like [Ruditapes philippinarum]|uniref:PGAP2-interacting protein-like n=1 Tax=Ruditapes philippinarum TaxID=129788 RepID=UPI00295B2C66|nr:PGAP2-interacting protein-like [Ruditapes philippinarum]
MGTKQTSKPEKQSKVVSSPDCISMRHTIREGINGYVFWCLFQGLAPMIWFYPLNDLEISGYEAFAALWFTQILAGIPLVRIFIHKWYVLGCLRGLCVCALLSFQAPTTLSRLVTLAAGNGVATLTLTATLWSPSKRIRASTCWGLLLGFIGFVVSRVWFTTFVPAWWSDMSNTVVVTIGAIAVIDQFLSGYDKIDEGERHVDKKLQYPNSLATGLGFGSLLFLINWVFGEVSLITRWTVRAYPDNGPEPYPWGACILVALCFGAYMSACRHVAISKIWWFIGLVSFCALYYLPTWLGFTGGLILGVYALSIWPEMCDRVSRCPPARTLFLAILVFMIQNFFLVWTVAYNFVPLGEYTRERTYILIAINMLCILAGLFVGGSTKDDGYTAFVNLHKKKTPPSSFNKGLILLLCVGLLGFGYRYNPQRFDHPVKKSPKQITTAIWTYHFGYDNKGWPSLERTASLLDDTGADVITMLESDASKPFLGNNDLGQWLSEKLGFYVDFGPSTKDHTWGNLILSKYPFVKSTYHLLPSPHGELAPAVTATVNVSGSLVDFVVTHMGNDRDKLDRKLQAEFLARETKNSENSVVFMGYVTSKPGSKEYVELLNEGNLKDIDDTDRKRFCEYIMYRGLKRQGYARITHGGLSDTELQMARFEIPDDINDFKDNSKVTYDTGEHIIPDNVKFNDKFGTLHHGHGYFSGHRFHMSTPKYFLP